MSASVADASLKQAVSDAASLYHRLVLLVGSVGSGKTQLLQQAAKELNAPLINLNLELSKELLELTSKQRALRLSGLLEQLLTQAEAPVLVLDNIEILFDKELKQDPLRLLQGLSRHRSIIASWNGAVIDGKLRYAEPGHPEYQSYDTKSLLLVDLGSSEKTFESQHLKGKIS